MYTGPTSGYGDPRRVEENTAVREQPNVIKVLEISGSQVRVKMNSAVVWMDLPMLRLMGIPLDKIKPGLVWRTRPHLLIAPE